MCMYNLFSLCFQNFRSLNMFWATKYAEQGLRANDKA
jgi:hypothetical protein